jgi:hypothetical protein
MRIILARLLWNFDITLSEKSYGWNDAHKVFQVWQKTPLKVKLTTRPVLEDD